MSTSRRSQIIDIIASRVPPERHLMFMDDLLTEEISKLDNQVDEMQPVVQLILRDQLLRAKALIKCLNYFLDSVEDGYLYY